MSFLELEDRENHYVASTLPLNKNFCDEEFVKGEEYANFEKFII